MALHAELPLFFDRVLGLRRLLKPQQIRKAALKAGATDVELDGGKSKGFCWMPFEDFVGFFDTMTVCHRSHGIQVRLFSSMSAQLDVRDLSGLGRS